MRSVVLLVGAWILALGAPCAGATKDDQFQLDNHVSICVDPPTPSRVARNSEEIKAMTECREWSSFAGTSALFGALEFRDCSSSVPLGRFLRSVLQAWNGNLPSQNPVTTTLFNTPAKFQLRPLREGESRKDALLVWKGMAALVVDDELPPASKPDLRRLRVLFPSKSNDCGTLVVRTADELAKTLAAPNEYKFLAPMRPLLFWNQWVEESGSAVEEPAQLSTARDYRYRIALSALDFDAFRRHEETARHHLTPDQADDYLPTVDSYRISVLPIGRFESKAAVVRSVAIDRDVLKRTLTEGTLPAESSLNKLGAHHDAMQVLDENGQPGGAFSFRFHLAAEGCAAIAVIIWSETRQIIVASWIRPVRTVLDESDLQCLEPGGVSRRAGLATIPWFDTANDKNVRARLAFVDFGGYTIASFQGLVDGDEPPASWVVERLDLLDALREFGDYVNRRVKRADFDTSGAATQLARLLFRCHELRDADCEGAEALRRLRELGQTEPGARVQVTFRDVASNSAVYLPIHLVEQSPGVLLGRNLRFVQPLPLPSPKRSGSGCVQTWSAGLLVGDYFDQGQWRRDWLESFVTTAHHSRFRNMNDLDGLRDDYFGNADLISDMPEGLVLLAHHGNGHLSDTPDRDAIEQITPDGIKRKFRAGSVALLIACSTGALGDAQRGSSPLLFRLNEKNVRAALVSPFEVPPRVARRFLDHFAAAVEASSQDRSLYDLVDDAKARLRTSTDPDDDNDGLKAAVDIFMLVGDGDLRVCHSGVTQ